MATLRWLGKAVDVKQVATLVIGGTWVGADTITLTIDGLDFVIAIGTLVTTAQVATTVQQAFQGSTLTDTTATVTINSAGGGAISIPQFSEITATVSSSTVTFTANTAGKPFTMSGAKSSTSGTITYNNAVVAATGKHFYDNVDNWSGGAVPADSDTIVFDGGNVDCKYGFGSANNYSVLTKTKGYTGNIGLDEINVDNPSKAYPEYRTKSLDRGSNAGIPVAYNLESGSGQGSGRVRINAGAVPATVILYGRGPRAVQGIPSVLFIGSNASNIVRNFAGDFASAFYGGEAATVVELQSGSVSSQAVDTVLGAGTTATNLDATVESGNCLIQSAFGSGSLIQSGGEVIVQGAGAMGDLDIRGGRFRALGTGTAATLEISGTGHFDKTEALQGQTITAEVQLYKGAKISDPAGKLTFTGGIKLNGCRLSDVTLDLGVDRELAIT